MSHSEPSSQSSLDLCTTPSGLVPVREVRSGVPACVALTTKSGPKLTDLKTNLPQIADHQWFYANKMCAAEISKKLKYVPSHPEIYLFSLTKKYIIWIKVSEKT